MLAGSEISTEEVLTAVGMPTEAEGTSAGVLQPDSGHIVPIAQIPPAQPSVFTNQPAFPLPLQSALDLLVTHHRQAPAVTFSAPADLTRACLKLFNVHPSELPSAIYMEFQAMMQNQVR